MLVMLRAEAVGVEEGRRGLRTIGPCRRAGEAAEGNDSYGHPSSTAPRKARGLLLLLLGVCVRVRDLGCLEER